MFFQTGQIDNRGVFNSLLSVQSPEGICTRRIDVALNLLSF
jgi:hypothetical protein